MSYDIELVDPVTRERLELPSEHVMTGGTYLAEYNEATGVFSPKPTREAWLNITYNYARYYYEATEGDARFAHDEISGYDADGNPKPVVTRYGIRGIYGKTGADSIPMLQDMLKRIESAYKKDGQWIITTREKRRYLNKSGKEVDFLYAIRHKEECTEEKYTEDVSEGPNNNYWEETAANAMRPLHQLIAMAKLRPDGIWDGD